MVTKTIFATNFDSIMGQIYVLATNDEIRYLHFLEPQIKEEVIYQDNELIKELKQQLEDYFTGKLKQFTLPIAMQKTLFANKVMNNLAATKIGETLTYKELAALSGNSKAYRAVASIMARNKVAIILPCHRVIGSNGKMCGYASGIDRKEKLLTLEKSYLDY